MWAEVAGLADILLCPSEWVATGVRELSPEHADKIRIVPYGCSINYEGRLNQPVRGRVLFAGSDIVRKGIQDLAEAATLPERVESGYRSPHRWLSARFHQITSCLCRPRFPWASRD